MPGGLGGSDVNGPDPFIQVPDKFNLILGRKPRKYRQVDSGPARSIRPVAHFELLGHAIRPDDIDKPIQNNAVIQVDLAHQFQSALNLGHYRTFLPVLETHGPGLPDLIKILQGRIVGVNRHPSPQHGKVQLSNRSTQFPGQSQKTVHFFNWLGSAAWVVALKVGSTAGGVPDRWG